VGLVLCWKLCKTTYSLSQQERDKRRKSDAFSHLSRPTTP
jgi:hypothetical protein